MSPALRIAPRVLALVAWGLAFTVAGGASTPRLRVPGRERAARAGIARAGSQRPDDPRAWVAPDTGHDPDCTVADAVIGDATPSARSQPETGASWFLGALQAEVARPLASNHADLRPRDGRLKRWLARPAAGRAPPLG